MSIKTKFKTFVQTSDLQNASTAILAYTTNVTTSELSVRKKRGGEFDFVHVSPLVIKTCNT